MAKFIRALAGSQQNIRIVACEATELVDKATIQLNYPLSVSITYGRALLASFLMSKLYKEGKLSINYNCDDAPIAKMTFVAGGGILKGAILESEDMTILEHSSPDAMLGAGSMTVNLEDDSGAVFSSKSPLKSGDLSNEISAYFILSEQKPTVLALAVSDDGRQIRLAAALMIQLLPSPSVEDAELVESIIPQLHKYADYLESGLSLEQALRKIFAETTALNVIEWENFDYHCDCDRQKVERVLLSLGSEELKDIQAETGETELHCHFCNKYYHFTSEDLTALIAELEGEN